MGSPVQVPLSAVRVLPTSAVPETAGVSVLTGPEAAKADGAAASSPMKIAVEATALRNLTIWFPLRVLVFGSCYLSGPVRHKSTNGELRYSNILRSRLEIFSSFCL